MLRSLMILLAAATITFAAPGTTRSEDYPSRPVRVLVGLQAGGSTDVLVRIIAQWLSERLGRPFVVENRPGGAGIVATGAALSAPPDGYTLLAITTTSTVNA